MPRRSLSFLVLFALALTPSLAAQSKPEVPEQDIKEHYTK
jgi:hypothetical protein